MANDTIRLNDNIREGVHGSPAALGYAISNQHDSSLARAAEERLRARTARHTDPHQMAFELIMSDGQTVGDKRPLSGLSRSLLASADVASPKISQDIGEKVAALPDRLQDDDTAPVPTRGKANSPVYEPIAPVLTPSSTEAPQIKVENSGPQPHRLNTNVGNFEVIIPIGAPPSIDVSQQPLKPGPNHLLQGNVQKFDAKTSSPIEGGTGSDGSSLHSMTSSRDQSSNIENTRLTGKVGSEKLDVIPLGGIQKVNLGGGHSTDVQFSHVSSGTVGRRYRGATANPNDPLSEVSGVLKDNGENSEPRYVIDVDQYVLNGAVHSVQDGSNFIRVQLRDERTETYEAPKIRF